jgi:polysaccharide biosynthesis protein PslH
MSSSIRVLFLTTEPPHPAMSGGRVRTMAQLRLLDSLPEVARIRVLHLYEATDASHDSQSLVTRLAKVDQVTRVFHPIHLKLFPSRIPWVVLQRGFGTPYLAGKWHSFEIEQAIRNAVYGYHPHVVYIDHLGLALYEPLLRVLCPTARICLDQHNVEHQFFEQFAERVRPPLQQIAKIEAASAKRFEQRVLAKIDHVSAISAVDAAVMKELAPSAEITAVPFVVPIVATDTSQRKARHSGVPELLYVGNLSWHPNVEGLAWFVKDVWPRLRALCPEVRLRVVGSGLAKDASGKAIVPASLQAEGIDVLGYVEDLAQVYREARVFIAPVVGGSGVRVKLLETLAQGVPIVTNTDGAAGLALESGKDLLLADAPDAFAEAVRDVLGNDALAERLSGGGLAYLAREHSLAVGQAAMRRVLGQNAPAATRTIEQPQGKLQGSDA